MKRILLIIPVYNGQRHLESTFHELERLLLELPNMRVVFVNDGSTDGTRDLLLGYAKGKDVQVHSYEKNQGKGYAVKEGITRYGKDAQVIAFTDVDIPYGIESIQRVCSACGRADIAVGTREVKNEHQEYSWYRSLGTHMFKKCIPREIRNISDTQCGLKAFTSSSAYEIFRRVSSPRWTFDLEIFLVAQNRGYTIEEVPVRLQSSKVDSSSISLGKDGFQILNELRMIRQNMRGHTYE